MGAVLYLSTHSASVFAHGDSIFYTIGSLAIGSAVGAISGAVTGAINTSLKLVVLCFALLVTGVGLAIAVLLFGNDSDGPQVLVIIPTIIFIGGILPAMIFGFIFNSVARSIRRAIRGDETIIRDDENAL